MRKTSAHGSSHDYEWADQNMLLLEHEEEEEEEEDEEDYVDSVNDDIHAATAISSTIAAASTWACSSIESGGSGSGRGLSLPNHAVAMKARGGIRRRPRTNRANSRETTVVKANPSNFRALVQQFTGCHSQLPYPPKAKGPINLNFAHYTSTTPIPNPTPTPTPTHTPITYYQYHPTRNISTSFHPPPGLQQQQGLPHSQHLNLFLFPNAHNNNNSNNVHDAAAFAAAATTATDHPQYPPLPPPSTSFSSNRDDVELIMQELSTMWDTHNDQYHY